MIEPGDEMRDLLEAIYNELNAGRSVMLATIVDRHGSAPRGTGAAMTVAQDGSQTGTVGGGSMEYRAQQDAKELLVGGTSDLRVYDIHAAEQGAKPGGVRILFRAFYGDEGRALAEKMLAAIESREAAYLVCDLALDGGYRSAVLSADALCENLKLDSAPDEPVLIGEGAQKLVEPLRDAPRVVLFGGGHVAQAMARQLGLLEYRVWVVEDREAFAKRELFPSAERVIFCDYRQAENIVRLTKWDHVIVMSRGHEPDFEILRWVLPAGADYIGCIGSKRKIEQIREKLISGGIAHEQIDRLHAPIGLSIGAETPAEIAVSVAAELIQYSAKKI
jgi:xanthine dehydrogenase accessory factor